MRNATRKIMDKLDEIDEWLGHWRMPLAFVLIVAGLYVFVIRGAEVHERYVGYRVQYNTTTQVWSLNKRPRNLALYINGLRAEQGKDYEVLEGNIKLLDKNLNTLETVLLADYDY